MGQRRDKAQASAGFCHPHITGRTAGLIGDVAHCKPLHQPRAHLRERQILVSPRAINFTQRHDFDQRQVHVSGMAPFNHPRQFILVEILQGHRIDFDGNAGIQRRVNAVMHLCQITPAGDFAELVGVERIHGHIDALDTAIGQFPRVAGELRAVGGHREFFEGTGRQMPRQIMKQLHNIAPHQRLAAGYPQLAGAARDESRAQPVQLFQREQIALGQKIHVFRHAIHATEIATVRDRHAQIGDGAAERVNQRGCSKHLVHRLYIR